MRILLTNHRLDFRAGSESYTRDIARGLQTLGHSVMAFSSDPAQGERLLENDLIPVATDLARLPVKPDIIHAQHPLDAIVALSALPGVPAIYHGHGSRGNSSVPRHPRLYRYLAASPLLEERISVEGKIDPGVIEQFLNAVDLGRFCSVRRLPEKALRLLFFGSHRSYESGTVSVIREAAARANLEFQLLDSDSDNQIERPEKILPTFDVVFASGRQALEALACGCAVVVASPGQCGAMVDEDNFSHLRQTDFMALPDAPASSEEVIERELGKYSPERSAAVSARVRHEANLRDSISALVRIYSQVIEQHQQTRPDLEAELLAASRYLREVTYLIKKADYQLEKHWACISRATSFNDLRARLTLLTARLKTLQPPAPDA